MSIHIDLNLKSTNILKRELTLENIKNLQLDILKEIHNYCIVNKIKYSLAYGTLLGAVRHKGYIPWDDDIDIWMMREDYDKFMSSFFSNRYKQIYKYNNSTYLPYGKVYDSYTVLIENTKHSISKGIFVDIFPIDHKPSHYFKIYKKAVNLFYKIKVIKEIKISSSRSHIKNIFLSLIKAITIPISYNNTLKILHRLLTSFSRNNNSFTDYNEYNNTVTFKSCCFNDLTQITFENCYFYAFNDFDKILTNIYGDYMQLPPIDKRITHHDFKAYWKE